MFVKQFQIIMSVPGAFLFLKAFTVFVHVMLYTHTHTHTFFHSSQYLAVWHHAVPFGNINMMFSLYVFYFYSNGSSHDP
jgi:hypothetical protein